MSHHIIKLIPLIAGTLLLYLMNFTSSAINLVSEQLEESLDCGLTDDFINFLNQNGIYFSLLKDTAHSHLIEATLSVDHMEVNDQLLKKSSKRQLFSFMEIVMLRLVEELKTDTLSGKPDSEVSLPTLLLKDTKKENSTQLHGVTEILTLLVVITTPSKISLT